MGTKVTMSASSIDTGLAHLQLVGQLEHQHHQSAAEQLVTTTHVVKKGRTATTETPISGVGVVWFVPLSSALNSSNGRLDWLDIEGL